MNNFLRPHGHKIQFVPASVREGDTYLNWLYSVFLENKKGNSLHERYCRVTTSMPPKDILRLLSDQFGEAICSSRNLKSKVDDSYQFVDFKDFKYFCTVRRSSGANPNEFVYTISLSSGDEEYADNTAKALQSLSQAAKSDNIFVISAGRNGLTLNNLGKLNYSLIRDNYEDSVLKTYDHIINEYSKQIPYGRLSILNGEAGTGKTNLLKGLISEIKDCKVVLLPAKLVSSLDSPDVVTLLLNEKADTYGTFYEDLATTEESELSKQSPILFIIEDADQCLVPRGDGNMSTISSLLNYTDGIFGSMLDLRIIATTNAKKMEFDSALLRPGRLCAHLPVDALSPTKASQIYKRLSGGKEKTYTKEATLATVYQDVNGGFKSEPIERSVLGFGK